MLLTIYYRSCGVKLQILNAAVVLTKSFLALLQNCKYRLALPLPAGLTYATYQPSTQATTYLSRDRGL